MAEQQKFLGTLRGKLQVGGQVELGGLRDGGPHVGDRLLTEDKRTFEFVKVEEGAVEVRQVLTRGPPATREAWRLERQERKYLVTKSL
jgi:hypothetical protein